MHKKKPCAALSLVCTFSPMFSPSSVQHPRRFSKCSISDFKEFLLKGGGSCLFNRPAKVRSSPIYHAASVIFTLFTSFWLPLQLFEKTECGNGFVETGEECDCGARAVSHRFFFWSSGDLFVARWFSQLRFILFISRSAIRNAVKSAPSPIVHSAAVAPAATPRV